MRLMQCRWTCSAGGEIAEQIADGDTKKAEDADKVKLVRLIVCVSHIHVQMHRKSSLSFVMAG